jgi:hypothetical protein
MGSGGRGRLRTLPPSLKLWRTRRRALVLKRCRTLGRGRDVALCAVGSDPPYLRGLSRFRRRQRRERESTGNDENAIGAVGVGLLSLRRTCLEFTKQSSKRNFDEWRRQDES